MQHNNIKIGFGGGCHWCTEAVFQCLKGVLNVAQGWVSSIGVSDTFSEAVIISFNPELIQLSHLIDIHLHTHKSISNHTMQSKYRSAIYTFSKGQETQSNKLLANFQKEFNFKLVTKVYPFNKFKPSREAIQNYYQKNPDKPFCQRYIDPKLKLLLEKFTKHVDVNKVGHLTL